MMGVSKVATSAPAIKIVLKLVMIRKPRAEEEVFELQEASMMIEVKEAFVSMLRTLPERIVRGFDKIFALRLGSAYNSLNIYCQILAE